MITNPDGTTNYTINSVESNSKSWIQGKPVPTTLLIAWMDRNSSTEYLKPLSNPYSFKIEVDGNVKIFKEKSIDMKQLRDTGIIKNIIDNIINN